jgi:general stress protein YciG
MDPERRRAIARKGGLAVPYEKRSFSLNHELAASPGRKGGLASQAAHHGDAPRGR